MRSHTEIGFGSRFVVPWEGIESSQERSARPTVVNTGGKNE